MNKCKFNYFLDIYNNSLFIFYNFFKYFDFSNFELDFYRKKNE